MSAHFVVTSPMVLFILGPVGDLAPMLKPLRDEPMVEVSPVALRNKPSRMPLLSFLRDNRWARKGRNQIKDQVWPARRQLKAVATMSLISRGALISRHGFSSQWSMVNHHYAMWKKPLTSVPSPRELAASSS